MLMVCLLPISNRISVHSEELFRLNFKTSTYKGTKNFRAIKNNSLQNFTYEVIYADLLLLNLKWSNSKQYHSYRTCSERISQNNGATLLVIIRLERSNP